MENTSSRNQAYQVWLLLHQASDAILRAREKETSQYGVLGTRAAVLYIINTIGDKATPTEISRWLIREPHSTSSLVSRMEKEGLVKKVNDPDRKNVVRVTLTEKGQKAYNQTSKRESIYKIMSSLSEKERRQLASFLRVLRDKALEDVGTGRKPLWPLSQ